MSSFVGTKILERSRTASGPLFLREQRVLDTQRNTVQRTSNLARSLQLSILPASASTSSPRVSRKELSVSGLSSAWIRSR